MTSPAKLLRYYNTRLMASATVRALVGSVSQDATAETIDYEKSARSVRAMARGLDGADVADARREIIGFLNDVHFTDITDPSWWWEMHTRFEKLLAVSMVLEGDNLRSFGVANPDARDIPQALVSIYEKIQNMRRDTFPALREQYARRTEALLRDPTSKAFVYCYTVKPQ